MQMEFTKENIDKAAQQVWNHGKEHSVWAFHAPMGAGKTTFISALCKAVLGVQENISSPTFAIINQYQSPVAGTIYHMDWYRLKSEEEAIQAGVEDAISNSNLCLIEWPEVAPALLPENSLHIYIELTGDDRRVIKIQ
ncbi:tRNA (adenosine(37)-N6)-threonylcarbamoyltransferase complex ATPase subunit type 1 TsaE [Ilyomonas limi]|uniref:tRNA threonylcarbamoyladenosine biosynthesis protein TsaE n=1 Tax=Ilyomonas limi TaxID=2575867 RepID=A0A4U3L1G7_9BACT|nr:tRNA (adenosine(37)-N6)-threonylcarbamoyltransferase complex ATPase subunit type 1 TsaE [Ilyomonas limi]TKK68838.1 tRNA (adenosine(37)-N6)-threonylcarbamoyltransferase complex ATPase subunit type 1 TsaE [Ilyomonas limi]